MPIIKAGSATKPTTYPKKPIYPLMPATGDIEQVTKWDEEAYRLWTPKYKFWVLNIVESFPDEIYGEPTDIEAGGEVYADEPIYVHAYIHWESSKKELSKWGITKERDIVVEFSAKMLRDMMNEVPPEGLNPKRGDVIVVDNTEYVLQEVKRGQPWYGNIQYPIHLYCASTIKKHSNLTDDRADEELETGPNHPASTGASYPSEPEDLYTDPFDI